MSDYRDSVLNTLNYLILLFFMDAHFLRCLVDGHCNMRKCESSKASSRIPGKPPCSANNI